MGVYSVATLNDLDSKNIMESRYSTDIDGALAMVAESNKIYNEIMKNVGIAELNYLETEGQEIVYEAVDIKAFIGKVKAFFAKILDTITSAFKKFIDSIREKIRGDKAFAEKYEKALKEVDPSKLENYEGYNFDDALLVPSTLVALNKASVESVNNEYGVNVTYEGIRHHDSKVIAVINEINVDEAIKVVKSFGGTVDPEDLPVALFKMFRNGEKLKTKLTNIDINEILNYIKNSFKLEKDSKDTYNHLSNIVKREISDLNALEKSVNSANKADKDGNIADKTFNDYISAISKVTAITRARLNALTVVNGAYFNALTAKRAQCKDICVELLKLKNEKENKKKEEPTVQNNSAFFEHSFENHLSKVVLK